jgi:hypothetical protein
MNRRAFMQLSALSLAAQKLRAQTVSGVMQLVAKRSYDLANTGCNLAETKLTPAYVKANGVRVLGTLQMQGDKVGAEAQPLVIPSVTMPDGLAHDLIVVLDMAGNAWCWDANAVGFPLLWMQHLANPILGTVAIDAWRINGNWCFLSSPVVDPATNILYAVGWQSPDGTAARGMHYFHAINLRDGSRVQPAIDLANTTYQPANGPLQHYNTTMRKQRSSLTLATIAGKKTVIWCAGTVSETSSTASGWIFAYDMATGKITARTLSNANYGAGVWMAGASVSIDSKGSIYLVSGNGLFDGVGSFGECAVRLSYTPPTATVAGTFAVTDWYCAYDDRQREGLSASAPMAAMVRNEAKLAGVNGLTKNASDAVNNASMNDQDLGSAQGALLEALGLYLVCGKDGIVYPVKIGNMGKTTTAQLQAGTQYAALAFPPQYWTFFPGWNISPDPTNPDALNVLYQGKTRHMHSTPVQYLSAVHGQMVACAGENSPIRVWNVTATGMTFLAQSLDVSSPNVATGMPGMFMAVSANGTANPLLYAVCPYNDANTTVSPAHLMIYDLDNLQGQTLVKIWDSADWGIAFDMCKFTPPCISGGKILLPTYNDRTLVLG